jgi:uncharacterized protein YecE (DUF72 family)
MQQPLFQPPPRDTRLRVGPAGWNYKDWEGIVYPAGAGGSFDPLRFISEYWDTVEINSSFYSPPRPLDCKRWTQRVSGNPRFRFTAKAWQRLTHEFKEAGGSRLQADCEAVLRSMAPLMEAGVFGALLIQFPWSYRYSEANVEHLRALFRQFAGLPLAVEVRHGSWDREPFYDLLRENKVCFCNVDQPVIGNSLKPSSRITARIGYFRLHGRNYRTWFQEGAGRDARYDYLYAPNEIREIAGLIQTVKQQAEETYAITNNHFRGQALANALEIMEELDANPPAVPPSLASAYPHLGERKDSSFA